MHKAVQQSIYYRTQIPSYLECPVITLYYSDKESLYNLDKEFNRSVDAKSVFNTTVCTRIIQTLPYLYDSLLVENLNSLYIVNREDYSIQFFNNSMENSEDQRIGIIKIDSVLAELKENTSWTGWVMGLSVLSLITVGTGYYFSDYLENE